VSESQVRNVLCSSSRVEIDPSHSDLVTNRTLHGRGRGFELFDGEGWASGMSGCVGIGHRVCWFWLAR